MKSTKTVHSTMALACAAVLLMASNAQAVSISVSAATLGANTSNTSNTSNPRSQNLSAVSVTNGGGSVLDEIGNTVIGEARYTSVTAADADALSGGSTTINPTHSYRVTLTITPDHPLTVYDLTLDTKRLGALVIRNEGGAIGEASISAVSGLINAVPDAGLGLAALPGISSNGTTVSQINQANSLTLTGLTGPQVFDVDFTWTSRAHSGNNVLNGGDEGVVILGMQGTISQVGAADDYPGTSGRTNGLAEDGHWLTATVLVTHVVPEPGTFALAGVAGLGLVGMAVRRRRHA